MNNRTKRLLMLLEDGGRKTVSGVPPLVFRSNGEALKNYRIYGNTVDGESVGDRTGNLFDMKKFAELCYPRYASVTFADNTLSFTSKAIDAYVNTVHSENATVADEYRPSCIDVLPSTTYTISMSSAPKCYISWVDSSYKVISAYTRIPEDQSSYTFTTPSNCTKLLIRLGKVVNNIGDEFTISNIMLNAGSTALPYEPYGYEVPVTVSNGTDTQTIPIYLPEQIRKVGDEAEYIDYGEQKQHFADGTFVDVELPALSTTAGINVLSVGTEVQPSNVEVMGKIKAVSAQPVLLSRQISEPLLFGSENGPDEPHQSAALTASPEGKPSFDVSEQLKGDDEYADDQSGYSSDENDLGDNSENTDDIGSDSEVGRESAGSAGTGQ